MLYKAEEVWRKNSLFMTNRNVSEICIQPVIYLYAWATSMDTLVGILMHSMKFIEGVSEEFGRKNIVRALSG